MLLSKTITDLLNKQLVHEGKNHLKYIAMAAYFSEMNLTGFEKLFIDQAQGEQEHYAKIYKYLSDKNAKITADTLPGAEFSAGADVLSTCKSIVKQFYEVEISTTHALYNIYDKAQTEKDFGTCQFLFDFLIPEQVEEESLALNVKAELDRCVTTGDLNNTDHRLKG